MSGLRFVSSDGSIPTVTIQDPASGIYRQLFYKPGDPRPRHVATENALQDGDDVPITTYGNVTETAEATLMSATPAQARAIKQAIERLLQQARHFARHRRGPRIYVEFQADGEVVWYRSLIRAGHTTVSDNALDQVMLPAADIHVTIHLTRAPFWEGPETYLTLTNRNGSTSGGLIVQNLADGTRDNFVTVATVDGDVPAPATLVYGNSYASGARVNTLYAGVATFSSGATPANLLFQAEGGTPIGGSAHADGRTWTVAGEQQIMSWSLPSSLLNQTRGCPFRVFARVLNPSQVELLANLYVGVTKLVDGNWAALGLGQLFDIGSLDLPPYLQGYAGAVTDLTLRLSARPKAGQASGTFTLDLLLLVPAESFRIYATGGYGAPQGAAFVDQGGEGYALTDGWSGGALGNVLPMGPPLMLTPGMTNRVHLVAHDDTGNWVLDRTGSVRIAYRPRRMHF